ncbi:MAG: sigma-70 family RNA polymerase sigma factor [Planctomycetota bacterium]
MNDSVANDFQSLLQRAERGDSDALTTLISHYEPQIRIVVRAKLGLPLRPLLDATDIVQSVHRSLIFGLQKGKYEFESGEKLVALAATIVRRKISRHWQRAKRESGLREDWDSRISSGLMDDPSVRLAGEEQAEQLLSRLPEADRRILELKLEGMSTNEAAIQLGLSPGVVRVRLSRIRQRLKQNLPIAKR